MGCQPLVEKMTKIIGFAGKGGTGKTTLTALFLKRLIEKGDQSILVVDADPNECLMDVLGIRNYVRVSDIMKKYENKSINPLDFEQDFKSMLVSNEQKKFDVLAMGRGEGKGCYCLVNNLLKTSFEENVLSKGYSYDYVLMDCEAGIEHISRKTSASVSDLIIVCDSSKMGVDTIKKIKDVLEEVGTEIMNFYVIANRVRQGKIFERIREYSSNLGMTYLGNIPVDPLVEEYNLDGKNLIELPSTSKAYKRICEIVDMIIE